MCVSSRGSLVWKKGKAIKGTGAKWSKGSLKFALDDVRLSLQMRKHLLDLGGRHSLYQSFYFSVCLKIL